MTLAPAEWSAAVSSAIVRLFTFCFLRWIPGHHFPPLVLTSVAVYLTTVFTQTRTFGRPLTLKEAFPRVLDGKTHHKEDKVEDDDSHSHGDGHEPIMYKDEKEVMKTIVFGIPDWREPAYSYITIGINILMALLTLDLVFRGPLLHPATDLRFSRVGFVDETSAKVIFREPDSAQLPVYAYLKAKHQSSWTTTDQIYYLDADTDYTRPITFTGLSPETTYIYSLSNDLSGTFTTAPAPKSPGAQQLTFLTTSCIKANFPYRPFSHALAIHGFDYLPAILRSLPSPAAFMLFLGDFIYVDVPLRLSSSFRHYRSEYRRVYASPSWSLPGVSSVPWLHTLDDHEIANDWSKGNDTAPFPAASDPFYHYHVSVNPPVPPSSPQSTNTTYFQFNRGPASFFMLDTRRYRTDPESATTQSPPANPSHSSSASSKRPSGTLPVTTTNNSSTMLGPQQLSALLTFLSTPPPANIHWKIIASSVPFTHNWRFGTSDTWGGFPTERAKVLAAMHLAERTLGVRVVVLSGDRHEFAAIRFPPPSPPPINVEKAATSLSSSSKSGGPHEFSVGPLSMFYLPIRTFRQVDDQDVAIKYLPDGNSKVGVVEIVNTNANTAVTGSSGRTGSLLRGIKTQKHRQKSTLKYTLWIDGVRTWEYMLESPGIGYEETGPGEGGSGGRQSSGGWFGLWSNDGF